MVETFSLWTGWSYGRLALEFFNRLGYRTVVETHKNNNGLQTFFEHWQFAVLAVLVLFTTEVLDFFENLCGTSWICFCAASFVLMICGAGLIGYAKFPVYRSSRFFTFGVNSVPDEMRRFYRWGWGVFLFGALLSLCLLLSKP